MVFKHEIFCSLWSGTVLRISWSVGLAQLVERLTTKREVAGAIPGTGPIRRVLKITEKCTAFAPQMARPSRGSDDNVKWRSHLQ